MTSRVGRLVATLLLVCGLSGALAPRAAADRNQCAPAGLDGATLLPKDLVNRAATERGDRRTTATVEPLSAVNVGTLGLGIPGVLTVGTLSDAPPNACINPTGGFSGFDNQLLSGIAKKLGLQVRFVGTDFAGLLAQVASRRFDVGSASLKAADARRRTVAFTRSSPTRWGLPAPRPTPSISWITARSWDRVHPLRSSKPRGRGACSASWTKFFDDLK